MTDVWKTKRLKDVADVRVSNVDKKSLPGELPVHLCNYMDVYANDYVVSGLPFMAATATRLEIEKFGLRLGDVMITKDSESPDDIGIPSVVVDEIDNLVCGYHLALIRPKAGEACPVYLAKQLAAERARRYFGVNASGSTRFGIPIGAIENFELPVPDVPEQAKLAEVLSTVDRAIAQTEASIAKQQRIKTGLMQDLRTRGIDEHGQLRSEATHCFKDSPLGRIPVEWKTTTIGEQFDVRRERGRAGLPIMSVVMRDGLVERSSVDRRVETALTREQHALVYEGDIAYNMMRMWQGVLGRAAFDCLVSPAYVVLKPHTTIDSRFAEWLFRDMNTIQAFRQASKGVVDDRLRLYPVDLFPIRLGMPKSTAEQSLIADRLDAQLAAIASEMCARDKLHHLKTALMQDLLTGKVRVTPLLEPAEAVTA